MSLRAADLRFALPVPVRSAAVLGGGGLVPRVAAGLRSAGVEVATAPSRAPVDLVVAPAALAAAALARPAAAHLLLGRAPGRLIVPDRHRGRPLLVRGEPARPVLVLPADEPAALQHYLRRMSAPASRWRRVRNLALGTAAGSLPVARVLPARSLATVVAAADVAYRPPLLVRAAERFGVTGGTGWILSLGTGDDLQRAVFHLLERGRPRWVLKFARVAGYDAPFRRDEAGLGLARAAGPVVAAHAPELLGRLDVGGLAASVETAAPGRPLLELLGRPDRAAAAAEVVESVAGWVVAVGTATALPPAALRAERARLERDVLPRWRAAGAPANLVAALPPVPGVLQHNDLGSWNLVTDGTGFTVVDWESARPTGLPVWDLLYLLADCLPRLDGPAEPPALTARALALFRGESPRSPVLFGWVRRAAESLGVPAAAVGPLATLCWLHHGLSAGHREAALAGGAPAPLGHLARLAAPWLADPALGPGWAAWSAWCRR